MVLGGVWGAAGQGCPGSCCGGTAARWDEGRELGLGMGGRVGSAFSSHCRTWRFSGAV